MKREGIYVGNKEVVARYIGDKLIWKKFKTLVTNITRETVSYEKNLRLNVTNARGNRVVDSFTGVNRLTLKHKWSDKVWELDNNMIESYYLYSTYLIINLKDKIENCFRGEKMTNTIYTNAIITLEYYE